MNEDMKNNNAAELEDDMLDKVSGGTGEYDVRKAIETGVCPLCGSRVEYCPPPPESYLEAVGYDYNYPRYMCIECSFCVNRYDKY